MSSSPPVRSVPDPDPGPPRGPDTKQRLLDAAEQLFADRGFDGTSMRAVTQAAGASVSAANYHFGSKEELLRAALRRRIGALNRRRIELLEAAQAAALDPTLEDLLDAWVRPAFELQEVDARGAFYRHVAARLYAEPPEAMASLRSELMADVLARFSGAIGRVLPHVAPEGHALLLQLAVGTLVHVLSGQIDSPQVGSGAEVLEAERERLLQTVVRFTAGGVRAAAEGAS